MPSEKKPLQRSTTEWIILTQDQTLILVSKIDELLEGLDKETFDGKGYYVNIVKSVRDASQRSKRISKKQLAIIQKGWTKTLQENLYVPGLEFYLLDNEEIMNKKANRRRKTKLDDEFYD